MNNLLTSAPLTVPVPTMYPPYIFEGDEWNGAEKALVRSALSGYLPAQVPPTFNEWHFFKYESGLYMALRAAQATATHHSSLGGLLAEIHDTYQSHPFYN